MLQSKAGANLCTRAVSLEHTVSLADSDLEFYLYIVDMKALISRADAQADLILR